MARNWRCFFCDEVFRSPKAAALHFGEFDSCEPDVTACKLMSHQQHVLEYIRGLEEEIRLYQAENHPTIKAMYAVEDEMRRAVKCAAEAKAALTKYGDQGAFQALRDANARIAELEGALEHNNSALDGANAIIEKLEADTFERWKRCPSTHCERRGECASPHECIIKPKPPKEKVALLASENGCLRAELSQTKRDLKDWQDSSEAYRHDAEKAEAYIKELNNKWADDVLRVDRAEAVLHLYAEAQRWATGTEEHRLALQKADTYRAALAPSPAGREG